MLTIAPPPLRDYQTALADECAALIRAAHPTPIGVLLQSATGSGKTRTGLELVLRHLARSPRHRALWFAHRDELVSQPVDKLRAWGAPVAALRPGEAQDDSARVLVASVQTVLARGLGSLPPFSLVVLDEARHYGAGAAEWHPLALAACERVPHFGLDASPVGNLRPLFAHLLAGPSVGELTDAGYLAPAIHIGPAAESETLTIDPIDAYCQHLLGERALLFAGNVAEAERYVAAAQARGIRAVCVSERTKTRDRRAAIVGYLRGEFDLLANVNCFLDGTDLPPTAGVIIARKVGEESTWVQMGGRALRPSPGKRYAKILDPYGLTYRLGLMREPRVWGLDSEDRAAAAALPRVVCCPGCLAIGPPSSRCPGCGRTTPPLPAKRLTLQAQKEIAQERRPRDGARWERFCALVQEGRAKGWKPQAAVLAFRREFGCFPMWRVDMVPAADGVGGGERRSA